MTTRAWIAVTDRLPDNGQVVWYYMPQIKEVDVGRFESYKNFAGETFHLWGGLMSAEVEEDGNVVTHWMPLQESEPPPP